jgi:osmoprotectant transport system ATP-binding protein
MRSGRSRKISGGLCRPVLRFSNVGYRAGGREVLSGLSFDLAEGQTLVLLGRSGAGKTTALKMVNALVMPSSGQVTVEGRSTADWDPIELRRRSGYAIQETGLFPHFTVAQNVSIVPRLMGWTPDRIESRVKELLERVGLAPGEYSGRYPRELSGGQRQRVGVARALAADPPVLLFDEPFGALDPVTRHEVRGEFKALARDLGKTTLFVTHDVREAIELGDQIGLMAGGRLEEFLPASEFRGARSQEARAFLKCLED